MSRLLPELHTTNLIMEAIKSEGGEGRLLWNASDRTAVFGGWLLLQPMWDSVKVFAHGIGVGCYLCKCDGEFLPEQVVMLLRAAIYGGR